MTVLGIPDELYWDLTPREIHSCIIQHYRQHDTWNMRFGRLMASVFNAKQMGNKKWKWMDWRNFFQPVTSQRRKAQTLQDLQTTMQEIAKQQEKRMP